MPSMLRHHGLISDLGSRTLTQLRTAGQTWPGVNNINPEPIGQIGAAYAIEKAGHAQIEDLLRLARQAGCTWYEIGSALGLHGYADVAHESIADVAHDYALRCAVARGLHEFTWPCPACSQIITDHSPYRELPVREEGHSIDCSRWTGELADWQRHHSDTP